MLPFISFHQFRPTLSGKFIFNSTHSICISTWKLILGFTVHICFINRILHCISLYFLRRGLWRTYWIPLVATIFVVQMERIILNEKYPIREEYIMSFSVLTYGICIQYVPSFEPKYSLVVRWLNRLSFSILLLRVLILLGHEWFWPSLCLSRSDKLIICTAFSSNIKSYLHLHMITAGNETNEKL